MRAVTRPRRVKSVVQQLLVLNTSASRPLKRDALSAAQIAQRAPGGADELARPLLAWFSGARRALPWREEPRDPYRTWLSEVMLQQTRVETMVPYFRRFLARFPTLHALARAPLDDVLARWSGLGYYARARNLHRAAQEAVARHGALPGTSALLRELPGFGPYTSAAVASLAFGEDAALVDGNVARVLARALGLAGDVERAKARAWEIAPRLLPIGRTGPFNEALMELGALVCTPRSPGCARCPLQASCVAAARGDAESIPAPKPKKARPHVIRAALRLERSGGQVLLQRQPAGALFEGLWDLPAVEVALAAGARAEEAGAIESAARSLAAALGAGLRLSHRARVEQTLTHREMRVEIFSAPAPRRDPARGRPELRWAATSAAALDSIGLSSLARKSLAASEALEPDAAAPAPRRRRPAPRPPPARPRR